MHYYIDCWNRSPIRVLADIRRPHILKNHMFVASEFNGKIWTMPAYPEIKSETLVKFKYLGKTRF